MQSLAPCPSPLIRAADAIARRNVALRTLLLRLLDPEDLGCSVSAPVRARIEAELFSHRTDDSFAPEAPAPDCDTADQSND